MFLAHRTHPVLTGVACALAQFVLTLSILLAGQALAPPEAFGKVKLLAFASTIVLPLLLVQAFGLWQEVGLRLRAGWPPAVFLASLLLVVLNLSNGFHAREGSSLVGDLLIQLPNAFGEELLFRGVVFVLLLRLPVWQAIVLNGVLFGSMHLLQGLMGADWAAAARQAAITSVSGMLFAAVRYRSASLWPVVALHMLKNLSVLYSNWQDSTIVQAVAIVFELAVIAWVIVKTPQEKAAVAASEPALPVRA
jgi:membrane protease YdiL (CAAX protease family)